MEISRKAAGGLSPGQDAVCDVLAKMLAAAKRGEIDAIAIVACSGDGAMSTDFKGAQGFECQLNMGIDHVKQQVRMSFLHACSQPASSVIMPDSGIIRPS